MPLPYYSRAASQEFWTEHWGGYDVESLVGVARTSPLTAILERALSPDGRILEAGCGLGQYVILMRERGRAAVGVDWSLEALRRCRAAAPGTPVAVMDLAHLAIRTGAVDAYVSLGVVEHDPAGPERIVAEAARVLAPGGRLLLSVPYWNGVRRLGARRLARRAERLRASGAAFYQFAFSRSEVHAFLEAAGFRVLSFHPYDPARLLRGAWQALRPRGSGPRGADVAPSAAEAGRAAGGRARPGDRRGLVHRLLRRALYSEPALRLFAHMILAVGVRR